MVKNYKKLRAKLVKICGKSYTKFKYGANG